MSKNKSGNGSSLLTICFLKYLPVFCTSCLPVFIIPLKAYFFLSLVYNHNT